jgi:hypothetical protein
MMHPAAGGSSQRGPAGRIRVKTGRGQLGPDLLGQLRRSEGKQVGQRRGRVAVAGGEPQRIDHLPGPAQGRPDGRVAELAGLGLVGLGGGVQLGIGGGREQERMEPEQAEEEAAEVELERALEDERWPAA